VFADPDPKVLVQGPEDGSVDLALLRVNYRFGGFGGPIVAKY